MRSMPAPDARSGTTSGRGPRGSIGDSAGGVNRGVAVAGDRVFMVTDHAHLIALNRVTGALMWETEMADWHQNYYTTGAPLRCRNLRDCRHLGWRRWRAWVSGGVRSGDRQGSLAILDGAAAAASLGRKRGRGRPSIIRAARRG